MTLGERFLLEWIWICRWAVLFKAVVYGIPRSRISVFEGVWTNWDSLCSRGAPRNTGWVCARERRRVGYWTTWLTDGTTEVGDMGRASVSSLRWCLISSSPLPMLIHFISWMMSHLHILFLISRVPLWCWSIITACICSPGIAFQHLESGMSHRLRVLYRRARLRGFRMFANPHRHLVTLFYSSGKLLANRWEFVLGHFSHVAI